jgi:hypothetical protein
MANAEFDFAPSDLQQGPASSKLQGETGERRARSHKGTEVRRIKQLNRMMMTLVRTPRENPSVAQGIEFPNTGVRRIQLVRRLGGRAGPRRMDEHEK